MGSLRCEPKVKPFLSDKEYQDCLKVLKDAQGASLESHVFFDMDSNENANKVRKSFLHVAQKEGIPVTIRRERGSQSLSLSFKDAGRSAPSRMSASECRHRIISALSNAKRALQKSEIISITGISPSTWNIRIKELMKAGKVSRHGDRRDTKYSLASAS